MSAWSPTRRIDPQQVGLAASAAVVPKGRYVTLSGLLSKQGSTRPLASHLLRVQYRTSSTSRWTTIRTLTTPSTGKWRLAVKVPSTRYFRVLALGCPGFFAASSASVKVRTR